jgi:hypothetical protein
MNMKFICSTSFLSCPGWGNIVEAFQAKLEEEEVDLKVEQIDEGQQFDQPNPTRDW